MCTINFGLYVILVLLHIKLKFRFTYIFKWLSVQKYCRLALYRLTNQYLQFLFESLKSGVNLTKQKSCPLWSLVNYLYRNEYLSAINEQLPTQYAAKQRTHLPDVCSTLLHSCLGYSDLSTLTQISSVVVISVHSRPVGLQIV